MSTLLIEGCTVEIQLPVVLPPEINGKATIKITPSKYIENLVVRCQDGKTLTIKKVFLRLTGEMLPVLSEDCKTVILFTVGDVEPDVITPVEVT